MSDLDQRMDMSTVARDRKTVTVHYDGMTQWVKVRDGGVLKSTPDAELYGVHACSVAAQALRNLKGADLD